MAKHILSTGRDNTRFGAPLVRAYTDGSTEIVDESRDAARALIARSVGHTEIAHAPYTEALAEALRALADDYSEPGAGEIAGDYWGTTESGAEWRVELDSEVAS